MELSCFHNSNKDSNLSDGFQTLLGSKDKIDGFVTHFSINYAEKEGSDQPLLMQRLIETFFVSMR